MRMCFWRLLLITAILAVLPHAVMAHCDSIDGPVIADAKAALEKGDITGLLRWVSKADEPELRAAFNRTLVVRSKGAEARELADTYFFETVVRIHRAGEGAPYTGLKPAGTQEPIVVQADKALEAGSVDEVVKTVTSAVESGLRERFADVAEAKEHADHNPDAGRKFVEAYVTYVHYVERVYTDAVTKPSHHNAEAAPAAEPQHKH